MLITKNFRLNDVFATNNLDLGSDHRAVYIEVGLCVYHQKERNKVHKRRLPRGWRPDACFNEKIDAELQEKHPKSLEELQTIFQETLQSHKPGVHDDVAKIRPWKAESVRELIALRRTCTPAERPGISKRIQREVRKQDRIYKTAASHAILKDFKDLNRLHLSRGVLR